MICKKVSEKKHGKMGQFMKVIIVRVTSTAKAYMYGAMAPPTTESGATIRSMARVSTRGQTDANTLVNGKRIKCMAMDR